MAAERVHRGLRYLPRGANAGMLRWCQRRWPPASPMGGEKKKKKKKKKKTLVVTLICKRVRAFASPPTGLGHQLLRLPRASRTLYNIRQNEQYTALFAWCRHSRA